MAILFVGSTPSDLGGITTNNTNSPGRDPNFTPLGSRLDGDFDEEGGGFSIITEPPTSNIVWYHFIFETNQDTSYNYIDGHWFTIYSGSTIVARADVRDSDWSLTGGGATSANFFPFTPNVQTTYDIKVECDGTNVTVTMYMGGVVAATLTYASTVSPPNHLSFDHFDMVWNTSDRTYYYSECIVTDNEATIGWRLATLTPGAAATYSDWDGTPANLVTFGDGLGIASNVAGQKESWNLSTYLGPASTGNVRAVVNKMIASAGLSGPTQITPFVRHAATDADGTTFTPNGELYVEVLDTNPQTGLGWDTADFATLEIGVKSTA